MDAREMQDKEAAVPAAQALNEMRDAIARIEKQYQNICLLLSPKSSRKYLSVEDAAERLDRSAWTVRQLCNAGQIRGVKGDDKTWRIPADEVARLEEEGVPRSKNGGSKNGVRL